MNTDLIKNGVALILEGLGCYDDPNDFDNFNLTPARVAKVYEEMFTPKPTTWAVFDEQHTDRVVLSGHVFYTLCPHHLLPVRFVAHVGYIPNGKVVGVSKLVRMIAEANTRPRTQEKLTELIMTSIKQLTQGTSRGEAVMLFGEHGCMRIRGVKTDGVIITDRYSGEFDSVEERRRFTELVLR